METVCFDKAVPWAMWGFKEKSPVVDESHVCDEELACMMDCVRLKGAVPLDHVHYTSVVAPMTTLHARTHFERAVPGLTAYRAVDASCEDKDWPGKVASIMRDRDVYRTVRAVACYVILYNGTRRPIRGWSSQEAADTVVGLYAGLSIPSDLLRGMLSARLTTVGGLSLLRLVARQVGWVMPGQQWDLVAHRNARGRLCTYYNPAADFFLGTFLLALGRLEGQGGYCGCTHCCVGGTAGVVVYA